MIEKLHHSDPKIAQKIHHIFQLSYAIEAKLLNVDYFPPLHRSINNIQNSSTAFYGIWNDEFLCSVIEIKWNKKSTHIQSLLVEPTFFRQGIAIKMLQFVTDNYISNITVETGLDNYPAVKLYERFGFKQTKKYLTDVGIMKVVFEKKINH